MKQVAIGVTLRYNKEFGAILVADLGSEDIAKSLCEGFAKEVRKGGNSAAVIQKGDRWTLKISENPSPEFPTEPTMERSGTLVKLTSHTLWLDEAKGKPVAQLPAGAQKASSVFTADLAFIDVIINAVEKAGGADKNAVQLIRDLRL